MKCNNCGRSNDDLRSVQNEEYLCVDCAPQEKDEPDMNQRENEIEAAAKNLLEQIYKRDGGPGTHCNRVVLDAYIAGANAHALDHPVVKQMAEAFQHILDYRICNCMHGCSCKNPTEISKEALEAYEKAKAGK